MTELKPYWLAGSKSEFGAITTGQMTIRYIGRVHTPLGRVPVIWCHHNMAGVPFPPWPALRDSAFSDGARAASAGSYPVIADAVGGDTAGNDATVLAGGIIDDIIAWSNTNFGTRLDKVFLWGDSLGAFNVLNWAWRNPVKVLGIVLRVPGTHLESLHDRNPFGAAAVIEAAYGGGAGYLAALPTHDPIRNVDLIRPFGDRIKIWAGTTDTVALTSEILAFAAQTGAQVRLITGNHDVVFLVRGDETTLWIREMIERKRRDVWDWSLPWVNLTETVVTAAVSGMPETWTKEIAVGPEGLRGRLTGVSVPGSNDRHAFLIPPFTAVDSEIYNEMHSFNSFFGGQQGNFHRVHITGPYSGESHVIWQNFFLGSPWILNFGVWVWDWSTNFFDTNQTGSATAIGVRNASGGSVLTASRTSNVYTFTCDFNHVPFIGDIIQTFDMTNATFNQVLIVQSVNESTGVMICTPQSGSQPNEPFGGFGVFANHNRFIFPFILKTRVQGASPASLHWKAWPYGHEEPSDTDPNFAGTHTFEAGHHSGYGRAGFLIAHLNRTMPLDQGRVIVTEL